MILYFHSHSKKLAVSVLKYFLIVNNQQSLIINNQAALHRKVISAQTNQSASAVRICLLVSTSNIQELGKPLFEKCWLYMGIAQIALDPPPLCQTGKCGKKVPQIILARLYTAP